jgi:hypothetical protein
MILHLPQEIMATEELIRGLPATLRRTRQQVFIRGNRSGPIPETDPKAS